MRYQINAVVNASSKDVDALVRLLVERAESMEIKALPHADSVPSRRPPPGGRPVRYGRHSVIRIGNEKAATAGQQGKMYASLVEFLRRGPKTRIEIGAFLKAKFPDKRSSVSPVLTQLLDIGALAVVDTPNK